MEEYQENQHLVDLIDEDDNTVVFEHLDTVRYQGNDYAVCIPFDDEEEVVTEVVIFLIHKDMEEDCLEQVEDSKVLADVYRMFQDRNADMFEFED